MTAADVRGERVECVDLSVRFSRFALGPLNVTLGAGEFFCLLGPSGSGKSTFLGLLGGWVTPQSGRIVIGSRDVTREPAHRRPSRACFQSTGYLFPHMTVAENVGFALRMKRASEAVVAARVDELLERVGLSRLRNARSTELSGGEAQRVGIARALADLQPLLLLDEVQASLDRRLRGEIRNLIVELASEHGLTACFVTHDSAEALALASRLSSRVGVLQDGNFAQIAYAHEIYYRPTSSYVARMTGEINILRLRGHEPGWVVTSGGMRIPSRMPAAGNERFVAFRPETVSVTREPTDGGVPVNVSSVEFFGNRYRIHFRDGDNAFFVEQSSHAGTPSHGPAHLVFDPETVWVLAE